MAAIKSTFLIVLIGAAITAATFFIAILLGADITFNSLEFIAVATSYSCTILFMLQKQIAYYYGIVSTFFLCIFFFSVGMPALALFNGILVFSLIYGIYRWGPDEKSIPVTRIKTLKSFAGYGLFFGVVGFIFSVITGSDSKIDILLASGSATAQLMLDNKKWENWIVWILVNIVSIVFFWQQGLILMAVQFALFLLNAVVALYRWYGDLEKGVSK